MSAEIASIADGIITVRITGKLTQPELSAVQTRTAAALQKEGKMGLLVVAENFEGWERGGKWGDLSFQVENDPLIEKLAIVGEKQWEDLALIFAAKGLRRFPVEFFPSADLAKARAWLLERPNP